MLPNASHERLVAPPGRCEVKIGQNGMPTFALSYDAWKNSTLPDYRYELDMPVLQYFSKFPTRSDAVATLTNAAESPPISPRIPDPALLWKAPPPSFKKSSMHSAPPKAPYVAPFKAPWVPKQTHVAPPPMVLHRAPFKAPYVAKNAQVAPPTSNANPAPFKAPFVSKNSRPGPSKAAPFKAPPPLAAGALAEIKLIFEKLREKEEKEEKMKMEEEKEKEKEKEREIEEAEKKKKEKEKERDRKNEENEKSGSSSMNDEWWTDKSVMEENNWSHRGVDKWRNNVSPASWGTWKRQQNKGTKQYWEAKKWNDWSDNDWSRWRNSTSTTSAVHQKGDDSKYHGQRGWWTKSRNGHWTASTTDW